MIRLRWKLDPRETGLNRVAAGPRGSTLRDTAKKRYAAVCFSRRAGGWFWVAGWESGVPHRNTSDAPVATVDEAKAAAMAYVREHLKEKP